MIILILMFVSLILGLVFSWGPDVWLFFLTTVGRFERLSWFSLIGTAVIAAYWTVFAIRMYSRANADIEIVEEGSFENGFKFGKKTLIVGVIITVLWIALFIFTDKSAVAAQNFAAWQIEKASSLAIARKCGHLLLAFFAGIFVSVLLRGKPRKKKKNTDENAQTEEVDQGGSSS